jgi:AcrR family transcriptional regulator
MFGRERSESNMTSNAQLKRLGASVRSRAGAPAAHAPREQSVRADNMLRIVEAASNLFATQGYAATSIEQVASVCSAGKDTIYRRFPSKLALFGAVLAHARARRVEQLERFAHKLPSSGDALDRLKRLARWFLDANLDPELVAFKRIAFTESQVFAGMQRPGSHEDPFLKLLVGYVADAQRAGMIADGDRWFIATQLVHCVVALPLSDMLVGGNEYASKSARDRHFRKAWALFLSGAAV